MGIKYSPLGDFPYSSSFSITASATDINSGSLLDTSSALFAESASTSLTPGIQGPPGNEVIIVGTLTPIP